MKKPKLINLKKKIKIISFDIDNTICRTKNNFDEVIRFKPEASRKSSKECYLLGKFKK